jgi:aspartyl protease
MLSRYLGAVALLLASAWTSQAQEARPPAAARIKAPDGVTRIPFELLDNRIYVEGQVDSRPARFLVDTTSLNVLTPSAAQRLGLNVEGKASTGEGAADPGVARASEVRVRAATLAKPVFSIVDLGELQRAEGVSFDGVLGYELFRHFGVQIDYQDRVMILTDSDRFAAPAGATMIPFEVQERTPVVRAKLDGMTVRLAVDTGVRDALTLHSPFIREHDLMARYRPAAESVTSWSVAGASRGRPARLGTLELGDRRIDQVAGVLFAGDKGPFASPAVSATLGGGALRRFTVVFAYFAGRMYLLPNSDFGKPGPLERIPVK